jgi:hypothetical protein
MHCLDNMIIGIIISIKGDLYSLPNIVPGGKIEKNEMGGACGAYGGG